MAGVTLVIVRAGDSELEKLGALQHVAAFTEGPLGDALADLVKTHQAGVVDRARAADE